MKKVRIVVGTICSGKTSYVQDNMLQGDTTVVDVGDIVRNIKGQKRTADKDLDTVLIQSLLASIDFHDSITIIGIRQLSIMTAIIEHIEEKEIDNEIIILDASPAERKRRFEKRNRESDKDITFEQAEELDTSLGLQDMLQYLRCSNNIKNIKTDENSI